MTIDPNKWIDTLPNNNLKSHSEENNLDHEKWIDTLPNNNLKSHSEENNLDHEKLILTLPKKDNKRFQKYFLSLTIIIIGLVSVSAIKNKTRNLQKEISNLNVSIDILKKDLNKSTLEHEFITSPENITRLAKEHLELELSSYKASQIKHLDNKNIELIVLDTTKKKKKKKLSESLKYEMRERIEKKKSEIEKLKKLYLDPKSIPGEVRAKVAKKIESKKLELKEIYKSPSEVINPDKFKKWGVIQVVKAFFGLPIIPGR